MVRNAMALASLFCLLLIPSSTLAEASEKVTEVSRERIEPGNLATLGSCVDCLPQIPLLESGRPPLPGEEGDGVESCALVNTSDAWDAFCLDHAIPDCPVLDDAFFAEHTIVTVVVDTLTARPCDGSPDPLWRLDCVTTTARGIDVRVIKQRPGGWCHCSMMPQQLQRLFLGSAVPKTDATGCRTCEEPHTIGCLR